MYIKIKFLKYNDRENLRPEKEDSPIASIHSYEDLKNSFRSRIVLSYPPLKAASIPLRPKTPLYAELVTKLANKLTALERITINLF